MYTGAWWAMVHGGRKESDTAEATWHRASFIVLRASEWRSVVDWTVSTTKKKKKQRYKLTILGPGYVVLFGNKVLADVIKLRWGKPGLRWVLTQELASFYGKEMWTQSDRERRVPREDAQRRRHHGTTETEAVVMSLKGRESQGSPTTSRS